MILKDVLGRHGIAVGDEANQRYKNIMAYLEAEDFKVDFAKPIDQLSDLEAYHLGKAIPLVDVTLPQFSVEIASRSRAALAEMGQNLRLEGRLVSLKDTVPYFAIYDLKTKEYDFAKPATERANKNMLEAILEDFFLKSGLKKSKRLKVLNVIFLDTQIRSSENLLVLYHLEGISDKFYYYFTNSATPSYHILQHFVVENNGEQ
jgi:hypothetical protein